MMENKCNKTPNKYLDHVYCQPGEAKNYMRPNNNNSSGGGGSTGSDLLALLKENKQLKAMLILHLDLIQEQSDQLLTKDKQICSLNEEIQTVRSKNAQFEVQVQELQRQVQRQIKRTAATPLGELTLLSPPPLAKIQCKKDSSSVSPTNIIGECNGKLISKIVLQRVNLPDGTVVDTHSPNSTTTISDTASEETVTNQQHEEQDEGEEDIEELTTEESNDEASVLLSKEQDDTSSSLLTTILPRGAKPRPPLGSIANTMTPTTTATPTTVPVQVCVTPPTPSRGKQMPLMLWHAPNIHSEEDSGSCDESTADLEQQQSTDVSPSIQSKPETPETTKTKSRKASQQAQGALQPNQRQNQNQQQQQQPQQTHKHKRRCIYITTQQMYATREWEDEDEAVCDYEFSQAEAEALHADAPMLEIPKWTEHELSPSYCIEGTEDLSDESFLKRHSKLEVDEKRRKKWDVQQIREQRRIEKLKRRHCKNEVQTTEQQTLKSFYPQPDNLQSICFVNELPVQAFGEMIPKLNISGGFALPWLQTETNTTNPTTLTTTSTTTPTTTTPTSTPAPTTTVANTTNTTNTITMTTNSSVEIMTNSTASSTSAQALAQMHKSTFVYLKKRKRQQSSSAGGAGGGVGGGTARQRTLAAAKVIPQTPTVPIVAVDLPAISTPAIETIVSEETTIPGEEKK